MEIKINPGLKMLEKVLGGKKRSNQEFKSTVHF